MPPRSAPSTTGEQRPSRLQRLHDAGVSIWLDTLSRDLLDSGEFDRLIACDAVTGATSNPTIFANAITGSDLYDEQLRAAAARGIEHPRELFFELALRDVGDAADRLRGVHDASGGRDGFVSFECTPELADDTDATIAQATGLWGRLARPNVMIKVPATAAGIPAIEELTARLVLRLARRRQGRCVAAVRLAAARADRRGQRPARVRPLPPSTADGVRAFCDSYAQLLSCIQTRLERLRAAA